MPTTPRGQRRRNAAKRARAQRARQRTSGAKRTAAPPRTSPNSNKGLFSQNIPGLTAGQNEFALALAALIPINLRVLAAWIKFENGPDDNPLNIGPGKHFGSPTAAAKATADLIKTPTYSMIVDSFGGSGRDQVHAIASSPWCPNCPGYEQTLLQLYNEMSGVPDTSFKGGMNIDWSSVGDAASKVLDSVTPDPLANIVKLLARLFEPSFWARVGKVILGSVALLIGLLMLGRAVLSAADNSEAGRALRPVRRGVARTARERRQERRYRRETKRAAEREGARQTAREEAKSKGQEDRRKRFWNNIESNPDIEKPPF